MLLGLPGVPEEHKIAAAGRAIDSRVSSNRVSKALVQEFSAAIAPLGDVEALRADKGEFGGGEFHATFLFGVNLNAKGISPLGTSVLRGSNKGAICAENGAIS